MRQTVSPSLFKAYDIRGVVTTTLTDDAVRLIGAALGSEAVEQKVAAVCVGRDGRLSGPMLRDALVEGITSAGVDVIDVGMVPTPVLYFSTVALETGSGVEITGSHNPPEYNGLKVMLAGSTLHGEAIQALRSRIALAWEIFSMSSSEACAACICFMNCSGDCGHVESECG